MLTKLTPEQEAMIPQWVQKWTAIGLSTGPADRGRAEEAIGGYYAAAKLPAPKHFIWTSSPMATAVIGPVAALLVTKFECEADDPRIQGLVSTVNEAIVAGETDPVKVAVTYCQKVVTDEAAAEVDKCVRDVIGNTWRRYIGGSSWAGWCAYVSFFRQVCNLPIPSETAEALTESAGWVWPHQTFAVLTDRPCELHRDETGRLHNPDGPSIRWRDGWATHHWRGTAVPAEWIESKDSVDPALALNWENIEQRRCLAEILGWNRVLTAVKTRVVVTDNFGTLLEADLPDAPRSRFVKVRCGTGRDFILPVPPEMKSAHEAVAWTYGMTPEEYGPEVRT